MRKIIAICLFVLSGCAATTQARLDGIQHNFAKGNFELTNQASVAEQNNLDLLINGSALFHDNKFSESDSFFEEFNKRNISETSSSLLRETSTLLAGGAINPYKPYMMDSLFVSYYQLWDLLALQDWSNARVVINQSYQRQQDMSRAYEKLIEKNKSRIYENSEIKELIDKNKGDWLAFREIMNPALMYLSGIYFLNAGDFETATTYLKRASGMVPENEYIKQDLALAQKRKLPQHISWQFIETGFAPRLTERGASLYIPNTGLIYFSYSVPVFDSDPSKCEKCAELANVDAMFMTEYKEYSTNEILRSFTSAASKAVLQGTLYNSDSDSFLGIMATIYTAASSDADVRTWATLPKNIYVVRTEKSDTIKTNELKYKRIINGKTTDEKTILLKGVNK